MKKIGVYILMALFCGGCIRVSGTGAYDGISSGHPESSRVLAAHAADHLAAAYPPGYTTLWVDTDSDFGANLENALRRKGFTVAPEGLPVGYNVDLVQDETSALCYLSLSLPGGGLISQLYNLSMGMVVPAGQLVKTGLPEFAGFMPPMMPISSDPLPPVPIGDIAENIPASSADGSLPVPVQTASIQAPLPEAPPASVPESSDTGPEVLKEPSAPWTEPGLPAVMPLPADGWAISPGMLRGQLELWTAQAGYQLIWKARHDFEMQSHAVFRDDFLGAVKRLFARMHLHGNPLRATIYQDNKVLEVVEE